MEDGRGYYAGQTVEGTAKVLEACVVSTNGPTPPPPQYAIRRAREMDASCREGGEEKDRMD